MYPQAKINPLGIPPLIEKMNRKLRFVTTGTPHFLYSIGSGTRAVTGGTAEQGNLLEMADGIVDEILQLTKEDIHEESL